MSSKPLWEKLQALQCPFTWDFEVKDPVDAEHILQTLSIKVEHSEYRNQGIYLATKAYLYHLQGHYKEALDSLQEAEEVQQRDHPNDFSRQVLTTYGNYAWVYYHLFNYEKVELYLGRVRQICESLASLEPYAAQIPESFAHKGWSFLAVGFRNSEEAKRCFRKALRGDESNPEFQAGLAISAFASWTHSKSEDDRVEATQLMGDVVRREPRNMEVKVYLAQLLKGRDQQRAGSLAEEAVRETLNPEVLRLASKFYMPASLPRAISILEQAVALAPSYHLLHHDLGVCYRMQGEIAPLRKKENFKRAATESFKRAVAGDPYSVFSRLQLGEMYMETNPRHAEELYRNLLEGLPTASKRCQQAIYRHWGDFLLQEKGLKQEALETYQAAYAIPEGHVWEKRQLKSRLVNLAGKFPRDQREEIYHFIRERETMSAGAGGGESRP
ncbi:antiviral innate immune response effector IFIT1-like [Paroedura picta]|uniref:antiviral innate immune response effector IFIT1-like n=1 Tax=Paroedura picta TaxID=143630 RepID=UPI004056FA38